MKINNKQEMYKLMREGAFGNINPHWFSLEEFFKSSYSGMVGIRSQIPGGKFKKNVSYGCVRKEVNEYSSKGIAYTISPMIPNDDLAIQGEIWDSPGGLYLNYSRIKDNMRDSMLKGSQHAENTEAKILLDYYLDTPSIFNIYRLLALYNNHVIEFSCFGHELGTLKHNTIIWKVRNY